MELRVPCSDKTDQTNAPGFSSAKYATRRSGPNSFPTGQSMEKVESHFRDFEKIKRAYLASQSTSCSMWKGIAVAVAQGYGHAQQNLSSRSIKPGTRFGSFNIGYSTDVHCDTGSFKATGLPVTNNKKQND
ncbi:hypothetical protein CTI12_AA319260 [Artemisia annua]|uniref:Uncharacterized protein n=1 Tax=Artemisia annua TaxID=35608 RepID=A0A2U1N167_ARTAN|nr:hypothetical protein CTI12_AA319260 [Artemisia annua]